MKRTCRTSADERVGKKANVDRNVRTLVRKKELLSVSLFFSLLLPVYICAADASPTLPVRLNISMLHSPDPRITSGIRYNTTLNSYTLEQFRTHSDKFIPGFIMRNKEVYRNSSISLGEDKRLFQIQNVNENINCSRKHISSEIHRIIGIQAEPLAQEFLFKKNSQTVAKNVQVRRPVGLETTSMQSGLKLSDRNKIQLSPHKLGNYFGYKRKRREINSIGSVAVYDRKVAADLTTAAPLSETTPVSQLITKLNVKRKLATRTQLLDTSDRGQNISKSQSVGSVTNEQGEKSRAKSTNSRNNMKKYQQEATPSDVGTNASKHSKTKSEIAASSDFKSAANVIRHKKTGVISLKDGTQLHANVVKENPSLDVGK